MKKRVEEKKEPSEDKQHGIMRGKDNIARPFALITQLGISMLVPIFLCVAVGLWLDRTFGTNLILLFLILGFLSGARNVWVLAKHEEMRQSRYTRKKKQYDLMKDWEDKGGKEE